MILKDVDKNTHLSCACYLCDRESQKGNQNFRIFLPSDINDGIKKSNRNPKQKCQKLVKSLSHTPSESAQQIFKSNSMQVLSPKLGPEINKVQEDYEIPKECNDVDEQATIKKLIEMGECSSESSTESAPVVKNNYQFLNEAVIVSVVTLRKVKSAACLGEYVSSVLLNGSESLPNISSTINENVKLTDVINYSSSSSTCMSERSGWVSSRSSSMTSLEANKPIFANGTIKSWCGLEKKLQNLTNSRSVKRYQKWDKIFINNKGTAL